jgi:nicotinamidase-related amidase
MSRAALLIIDMQNDFVREGSPLRMEGAAKVIGQVRSALEIFRRCRLPIFPAAQCSPEGRLGCGDLLA